jgi:hypothetical protein
MTKHHKLGISFMTLPPDKDEVLTHGPTNKFGSTDNEATSNFLPERHK